MLDLTIAIPTFNRAPFLRVCLRSIQEGLRGREGVEILISDNASTDDTPAVVEEFHALGLPIRYVRQEQNVGFDRNFEQVVLQARGRYTWAMGDDDWIERGGLAVVLGLLSAHPDTAGLTIECTSYGADGAGLDTKPGSGAARVFAPAADGMLDSLLPHRLCNLTLNVFGTARAQEALAEAPLPRNACAAHALMLRMIARAERWVYADVRAAAWRYGNDGFMQQGLLRRARIALYAYLDNLRAVFGEDSAAYSHFRDVILPPLALSFILRATNAPRYTRDYRPYHCGFVERSTLRWEVARVLGARRPFWTKLLVPMLLPAPLWRLYASLRDRAGGKAPP